jgi:hypothetical protein
LRAQLANVHIFEPLSAEQVHAVFALGIHYVGGFDACTLASFKQHHTLDQVVHGMVAEEQLTTESFFDAAPPDALALGPPGAAVSASTERTARAAKRNASTDSLAARQLLEQPVDSLLLVMFPAQLCRNGQVRNQAAAVRAPDVEPPPAILSGTLCVQRNVRQVIGTVGGVQVLCFLLAQLDDAVEAMAAHAASGADPATEQPTRALLGEQCVSAFFALLQEVLREDVNTAQVIQGRTLGIVSALLQRSQHATLSMASLEAVQALLERASPKAEFVRAVCKQILFDFDLWRRSDFSTRLGHLRVVSALVRAHPAFFRLHYGVQFALDLLRPRSEAGAKNRAFARDASMGPAAGSGMENEDLRSLQQGILSLVADYLETEVAPGESQALLRFLLSTEDTASLLLLLEFLTRKLRLGLGTRGTASAWPGRGGGELDAWWLG